MRSLRISRACALAAALVAGCLKPEMAGPGSDPDSAVIRDDDRTAGATSTTNWPPEDAGTQPIQVYGRADSALTFTFRQAAHPGEEPRNIAWRGTIRLYHAGYIPVFDSVPAIDLSFPLSDSIRIGAEDLDRLTAGAEDTLRFSAEIGSGSEAGLMIGFSYSVKRKEFLEWPRPINTEGSLSLSDAHYFFAGKPDSAFRSFLSDTGGNATFYYYIPGSPYFWRNPLAGDSLSIGPIYKGGFPLRCVKVISDADPTAGYAVEVFPMEMQKEAANDSIRHFETRYVFRLGPSLLRFTGRGSLPLRAP